MVDFSRRVDWSAQKNRLTRLWDEKRAAGRQVLDLTESNPTHVGLKYPAGTILNALSAQGGLDYQPDPRGLLSARRAVSRCYRDRGIDLDAERFILTAGSSEAYAHLFRLLANPGENFLTPQPSYPLFDFLASLESVALRGYRLAYDGRWSIDFDSLEEAINAETRAIVLVNPNNPTGSYLRADDRKRLRILCRERKLALIVDEVFSDYALRPESDAVHSAAGEEEILTFVLNGLSKISALPQMKLGWIAVSGPAELRNPALEKLELIADTFLSVGTPVQLAAEELLGVARNLQPQIMGRAATNLALLGDQLRGTPAEPWNVEGGWYAVVRLPQTRPEEEWALALLGQQDVLAHPGYFFDFPQESFLVVSLLTQEAVFQEGISRFRKLLSF